MATNLYLQPSSFAGYAALAAGAFQMVATQGLPHGPAQWTLFSANILGGLAAIFKSEGVTTLPVTGAVAPTV